jgi:hypothetical protein
VLLERPLSERLERSNAVERLEQLERAAVFDSAKHVEINVDHTAMQVLVDLDGGGVITIFPERTLRCPLRWLYSCAVRPAISCIL